MNLPELIGQHRHFAGDLDTSVRWEGWSLNGEVCVVDRLPASARHEQVVEILWWVLREYASHSRRCHDVSGMFPAAHETGQDPFVLRHSLCARFDLRLANPGVVRERVRRRGGDPAASKWPAVWLEHEGLVVLAELAQVKISARGPTGAGLLRAWTRCLDGLDRVSVDAAAAALKPDEGGFLLSMLAATHEQRSDPARRPALETSYERHEDVVRALGDLGTEKGWPLSWHALWRLPP